MKKITLKALEVKNFKGIKKFSLIPDGKDCIVYGDNATGKTTLKDAMSWLLTGKDSNNKTDFQLKPVTTNGFVIHKLETEVEAIFSIDKKDVSLRKRYYEKYVKTRGKATRDFSGHTTDHFIDGVPENEKDFKEKVAKIMDIKALPLLTDTMAFNNLHWEKRRGILLDICGAMSDKEVVLTSKTLAPLKDVLKDSTINDYKKKLKAEQKEINEELESIPARISENQNLVKSVGKPDDSMKEKFEKGINTIDDKIADIRSDTAVSEKKVRVNDIKIEISNVVQLHKENVRLELQKHTKDIVSEQTDVRNKKRALEVKIEDAKADMQRLTKKSNLLIESMSKRRSDWKKINNEDLQFNEYCPCCEQELPADEVKSLKEKAQNKKAESLKDITIGGKESKKLLDSIVKDCEKIETIMTKNENNLESCETTIVDLQDKFNNLKLPSFKDADTSSLEKEKKKLEKQITALESGSGKELDQLRSHLEDQKDRLDEWKDNLSAWDSDQTALKRIKELDQQEKTLAKQYEKIEKKLDLIDQFIIAKVELSEEQLNDHFNLAKFKLFDIQINGGVRECCRTLYDGVPFNRGLNKGARINVGLDIINTLSEYYGFKMPVFIDNAESCTNIDKTNFQLLQLVVKKSAKKLTVK